MVRPRNSQLRGSKASTTVPLKFGKGETKPVLIQRSAIAKAGRRGGRLYEDGNVGGSGQTRGSKAAPGPSRASANRAGSIGAYHAGKNNAVNRTVPKIPLPPAVRPPKRSVVGQVLAGVGALASSQKKKR